MSQDNQPIYKIHGKDRRILKKELSLLKFYLSRMWYYEDVDRAYGGGLSDYEYNRQHNRAERKIKLLEIKLNEKYENIN